jgi:hypothetical protein
MHVLDESRSWRCVISSEAHQDGREFENVIQFPAREACQIMIEKVTTTDDALHLYRERDLSSPLITQLGKGTEIQLGAKTVLEGREWIEATVEDNSGYILGSSARGHTTLGASRSFVKPAGKAAQTCPRCALISPGGTRRCECGFDLEASPERVIDEFERSQREAIGPAILGLLMVIGVIAWFIAGYSVSPESPHILFYGLVILGLGMAGRSINRIRNLRTARREYEKSVSP